MSGKLIPLKNNILYLETDSPQATVKVFCEEKEVAAISWEAHYVLSKTLSKKVEEVLSAGEIKASDLTGIAVFVGPGSFTGLRIGISFANGLAFALGIPVFESKEKGTFSLDEPKKIVLPIYGSEPKITTPKNFCG